MKKSSSHSIKGTSKEEKTKEVRKQVRRALIERKRERRYPP